MAESSVARRERPFGIEAWSPFRDLDLTSRFGRLFEDLMGPDGPRALQGVSAPPVDITETDDAYLVTAEIPGVKKNDLKLEIEDGVLTIAGEKKSEREETKEKGRWLERSYGAFSRSFTLPSDANGDKIDASFSEGVLQVKIAKSPEAKSKTIAVK